MINNDGNDDDINDDGDDDDLLIAYVLYTYRHRDPGDLQGLYLDIPYLMSKK